MRQVLASDPGLSSTVSAGTVDTSTVFCAAWMVGNKKNFRSSILSAFRLSKLSGMRTLFSTCFMWSEMMRLKLPMRGNESCRSQIRRCISSKHACSAQKRITFGNEYKSTRTNGERKGKPCRHRRIRTPTLEIRINYHISDAHDAAIELVTSTVHVVELELYLRHNVFTGCHLKACARLQARTGSHSASNA